MKKIMLFVLFFVVFIAPLTYGQQMKLKIYPEKVCLCDPVYIVLECTNNTAMIQEFVIPDLIGTGYLGSLGKLELMCDGSITRIIPEVSLCPPESKSDPRAKKISISPRSTYLCPMLSVFLPVLDELHCDFWQKVVTRLPQEGKTFEIRMSYIRPKFECDFLARVFWLGGYGFFDLVRTVHSILWLRRTWAIARLLRGGWGWWDCY